jgi:hypothetical protein
MSSSTSARHAARIGIASALLAACIGACSSDRSGFESSEDSFQQADAAAPDANAAECGVHCSRDLKTVLTGCEGAEQVTETCGVDEGCGQGHCVPACEAAQLSKGSVGCEFWTLPADVAEQSKGACFAAMVSNTWNRAVTLSAEYGSAALDISQSIYTVAIVDGAPSYTLLKGPLPEGQVAVVFLAEAPDTEQFEGVLCPKGVVAAVHADPIQHGSTRTTAFQLMTDAPISAYSIFPYGGSNSYLPTATLLLPVSSWANDYIAVSPFDFGYPSERTLQIIASQDDTVVSIRPNVEVPAGDGTEGATTGITQSWTLARGQVLQFTQASMTGSPISTTKPVGLFGGARCSYIPSDDPACDVLQQQIPPTAQWGSQYALVPYPSRVVDTSQVVRETVPYTVVSVADGTTFTYEPARPVGAPSKLDAGQSATFMTDELLVLHSQDSKHPFYAAVYMTGQNYGQGSAGAGFRTGDPDFVTLAAADQFLDRYVFFTDFTYPDTRLTVVRRKTANGFLPVELECAGPIDGFQPIGTSGEFEYAWVSLTTGGVPEKFAKGACGYGRQEAHSEGPFSVTVWGLGSYASYGYLAGTGLRPINDVAPPVLK